MTEFINFENKKIMHEFNEYLLSPKRKIRKLKNMVPRKIIVPRIRLGIAQPRRLFE